MKNKFKKRSARAQLKNGKEEDYVIAPSGAKIPRKDWDNYQKACKTISTLILRGFVKTS